MLSSSHVPADNFSLFCIWAASWEYKRSGFRSGPTQTRLYSYRRWPEAWNFGFRGIVLSMQQKQRRWSPSRLPRSWSASLFSHMQNFGFLMTRLIRHWWNTRITVCCPCHLSFFNIIKLPFSFLVAGHCLSLLFLYVHSVSRSQLPIIPVLRSLL